MDINNLWSEYDLNSKKQSSRCLAVNTILEGKYLVGPVLGQGGFGITYVGYDLNMESKIAIKEYFPVELVSRDTTTVHGDCVLSLSGEKSVTYKAGLKKYVTEAQNVSQFSEVPGVVSVKDFFYANETAYIVMEFIDGISLKDYLKEKGGRLTEEEALAIMKPVLEALVQVHKSGIIHRDISPDNIMLTFEDTDHNFGARLGSDAGNSTVAGQSNNERTKNTTGKFYKKIKDVKLIDFGAARMTEKNDQKSLTIILKHGYAPEEQYRTHGEQGPWTDVYALCAVLYRMLTGETPMPAMDRMFQDELKSFEQCNAKVSVNTAAAILKGLAVKKEDRIQSVQELIAVLYEGAKVTVTKSSGTPVIGKKMPLLAGGAAVVVAVVAGVIFASGGIGQEQPLSSVPTEMNAHTMETEQAKEVLADKAETMTSAIENSMIEVEVKEEMLGEQILSYRTQRSIAAPHNGSHIVICKPDGTVEARGNNEAGQCDVEYWDSVAAVEAGEESSFGLRTDGTVLFTGKENGYEEVTLWTDIIDLQATRECVIGLKKDGTVVSAADLNRAMHSEEPIEVAQEVSSWTDIKSIASYNYGIYGLTEDGDVVVAGDEMDVEITGWTDVEQLVANSNGIYGICEDGTVKASGENEAPEGCFLFFDDGMGVWTDGTVYSRYGNTTLGVFEWNDLLSVSNPTDYADGPYFGLKSDGTILEYMYVDGNDVAPETMRNLKSIQCISNTEGNDVLFGISKDNEICKYGQLFGNESVLDYNSTLCWYNGYAALYEDGTFLYTNTSDSFARVDGVKQVEEMITHQTWYENGEMVTVYAYLLLMKDGTVRRLGDGYDTVGFQYYADVMEDFAEVETWTDIVQIEGSGLYDVYGIKADGSLVAAGRRSPEMLESLGAYESPAYKQICASEDESLFCLTQNGELTALTVGIRDDERGLSLAVGWDHVETFSMGDYHIAALLEDGTVKAIGGNHCGQCDVETWTDVVYLTTGKNCTLGITTEGRLLMAGSLY